jgi:hypothetical protein
MSKVYIWRNILTKQEVALTPDAAAQKLKLPKQSVKKHMDGSVYSINCWTTYSAITKERQLAKAFDRELVRAKLKALLTQVRPDEVNLVENLLIKL